MVGLHIKLDKKQLIEHINMIDNDNFVLVFTPFNSGKMLEIVIELELDEKKKIIL